MGSVCQAIISSVFALHASAERIILFSNSGRSRWVHLPSKMGLGNGYLDGG